MRDHAQRRRIATVRVCLLLDSTTSTQKDHHMISFKIRGRAFTAGSLKEASEIYCRERDESCEGASTFPMPTIIEDGKVVGRLSYNGRIRGTGSNEGTLIYDNRDGD